MKTTKDSETIAVEDPIIDELQKEIIKNLTLIVLIVLASPPAVLVMVDQKL